MGSSAAGRGGKEVNSQVRLKRNERRKKRRPILFQKHRSAFLFRIRMGSAHSACLLGLARPYLCSDRLRFHSVRTCAHCLDTRFPFSALAPNFRPLAVVRTASVSGDLPPRHDKGGRTFVLLCVIPGIAYGRSTMYVFYTGYATKLLLQTPAISLR